MSFVRPSKSCKKLESRHSRRSFGGAKARKPRSFGRGFFRPQQPSADDRGLHHRWRRGVRVHLSLKPPLRKVAEPVTASCSQGFTKEQVYLRQLAFSKVIRSDIYFRPLHDSGEYFPSSSYSGNNFPSRFMNTSRLQRGDGRCTCPRCRLYGKVDSSRHPRFPGCMSGRGGVSDTSTQERISGPVLPQASPDRDSRRVSSLIRSDPMSAFYSPSPGYFPSTVKASSTFPPAPPNWS